MTLGTDLSVCNSHSCQFLIFLHIRLSFCVFFTCVNKAYFMYMYKIRLLTRGTDENVISMLFKTLVVLDVMLLGHLVDITRMSQNDVHCQNG